MQPGQSISQSQGWYIILITKRRCMAMIGAHFIYKVEDVVMFPVASEDVFGPPVQDEARYVNSFLVYCFSSLETPKTRATHLFQNVDVTSNFYYSYTYDLSRPLQSNMHLSASPDGSAVS